MSSLSNMFDKPTKLQNPQNRSGPGTEKRGWRRPASFGYAVMGDGAQPTYFMPEFSVAVMSLTRLADHSEYALFVMALRTWTIQ